MLPVDVVRNTINNSYLWMHTRIYLYAMCNQGNQLCSITALELTYNWNYIICSRPTICMQHGHTILNIHDIASL